jgi:hypothetical protein
VKLWLPHNSKGRMEHFNSLNGNVTCNFTDAWCSQVNWALHYRVKPVGHCDTLAKKTRANNVLKYQFLNQSLVQYIIQVVHSRTTLLIKYKTLQHDDDTN